MEFYETVTRRRTVREFLPDPIPEEILRRVLESGLQAPCNAHLKPWQFVLLRDQEKRRQMVVDGLRARDMKDKAEIERFLKRFNDEALKEVYRRALPVQLTMMLEAPELLIVCTQMKPPDECHTLFELNPLASVWMCIENIMLAMAAEGIFGCTYTPYDASGLKSALCIPSGWEVVAVIPFGYPQKMPVPYSDEDLDRRLHINVW